MVALLRFAKDIKARDRFRHDETRWTAVDVQELVTKCGSCGCQTVPMVRIIVEGGALTLPPKEVVEVIVVPPASDIS